MNEYILNDFETFQEVPEGLLEIKENSNAYLIIIDNKKYIVREKLTLATTETINNKKCVMYTKKYYNIIDNHLVLINTDAYALDTNEKVFTDCQNIILSLSQILNIKGNNVAYLGISDITNLINFEEVESKQPRKTYF